MCTCVCPYDYDQALKSVPCKCLEGKNFGLVIKDDVNREKKSVHYLKLGPFAYRPSESGRIYTKA